MNYSLKSTCVYICIILNILIYTYMQLHHLLNMPDFIIGQVLEGPTWLSCRQCDLVYMSGWWLSPTPRKKI